MYSGMIMLKQAHRERSCMLETPSLPRESRNYLHTAERGITTSFCPAVAASPTARKWLGILNRAPEGKESGWAEEL